MERITEVERYPNDKKSLGTSGRTSLSHYSQRVKLQEKFKQERHSFTYGEIHHEIEKDANDSPCKASRNHQKDQILGKITAKDEIVKYMSNLPSYLERGEHLQEKVLSVGVLDWGRLEKWQCAHKQISCKSSRNPPVRSNGSSSSTDSSSPHFGKDNISPSCQRLRRPSLYSHLLASPHSQFVKSFGGSDEKCQDLEIFRDSLGKVIQRDRHSCKNNQEVKIKQLEWKDPEMKILQTCKTLPGGLNYEVASSQCGEFTGLEKSQAQDSEANDHDNLEKPEAFVLPSNLLKSNYRDVSKLSESTTLSSQKSKEASQKSSMERSKVSFPAELKSDIPNSSKTLGEVNRKQFLLKQNCSINISNTSHPVSRSTAAGFGLSKGRNFEAKASVVAPLNSMVREASSGLDLTASAVTADKERSSSPFSRLSIGMGRRRKSSSSMGNSCISDQGSTLMSVKSGSENAMPSACLNDSSNETSSTTGRASSSPLRRLLDPLLKPKAAICYHAKEPLEKDLNDMSGKAYNQQSDSSTVHARKLKLDMSRCRKINVNDSALDRKQVPSIVQGLLQVAFKNGLPLFTFAVDNASNILAATMKLTSSGKEKSSHIYTFFTVQEVKKKNGSWINQGSKAKSHDYVSNVIAQMKVSEPQTTHLTKPDEPSLREFVLISVDLRQADQRNSDFQPNEELAAIVVKIPPKVKQSIVRDDFQRNVYNNLPEDGSRECFSGVKSYPCSKESVLVWQPAGSEAFISITVLLPSGVHSLPSKGGPSSLIERWNSGGSCDCGGWDLGCKLRVLANQNQVIEKSSSRAPSAVIDQFKLFPQEGVAESCCILSLATFKDMIYSVEFDSSLSLLQAFSICLAMIDSRSSCELSDSSILFEAKTYGEAKLVKNDRLRTPNIAQREIPAEHVTCPPLSPFGRV